MSFPLSHSDAEFKRWLAQTPSEDELREAYLALESHRADLWRPGHIDSYRHDRFERDHRCVTRLVHIKFALARRWHETGQFSRFEPTPQVA